MPGVAARPGMTGPALFLCNICNLGRAFLFFLALQDGFCVKTVKVLADDVFDCQNVDYTV